MAEYKTLSNVFDCTMECWTQPTLFVNAFTHRPLTSPHSTRPSTNFVKPHAGKNLPKNDAYQQKAEPYQHQNLAIHGFKLCHYPHLAAMTNAGNTAGHVQRPKRLRQATPKKHKRFGVATHSPAPTGASSPSFLDIIQFSWNHSEKQTSVAYPYSPMLQSRNRPWQHPRLWKKSTYKLSVTSEHVEWFAIG